MPSIRRVGRFVGLLAAAATFLALPALAQEVPDAIPGLQDALTGAGEGGLSSTVIQLFLLVTILSLAPGIAMMVTCLPFMVIVFSFMRQAVGVQQAPPNMMIMALAMFLTFFVMEPVFMDAWGNGVSPYMDGLIDEAPRSPKWGTPGCSPSTTSGRPWCTARGPRGRSPGTTAPRGRGCRNRSNCAAGGPRHRRLHRRAHGALEALVSEQLRGSALGVECYREVSLNIDGSHRRAQCT